MSDRVKPPEGGVLFLLSSLTIGGSERKTIRLVNALAEQSRRVVVAYLGGPHTLLESIAPGVEVFHVGRRGLFSLSACFRLRQFVGCKDFRTIVCINLYPMIYALFAGSFKGSRSPRVLVSINTTEFESKWTQRQMWLYRWLLKCVDGLIFGAQIQREIWYQRYRLRSDSRHDIVLYNGVNLEVFAPVYRAHDTPAADRPAPLVIGTVGKLRVEKSHFDLIDAVQRLRRKGLDVEGIIVGDGPEREVLTRHIDTLGIADHFRIVGEVDDVRGYLSGMDVFVLTSTKVETFSNATLEAMSMGIPVVSSRIGGMGEMLEHGGGLLYAPGNLDELCSRLTELLSDRRRLRELGLRGRQVAKENFSWQRMVDAFAAYVYSAEKI